MERTQISLTAEQAARLKRAAAGQGVSMSHLIREAIDAYVPDAAADREARVRRAFAAVGRFHSGVSDLSERHDDYLAEDPTGW
jgi:metal-responsive CopG/Arc/MetJ family transcriptional regulator